MNWRKIKYAIPLLGIVFVIEDTQDLVWAFTATIWSSLWIVILINLLVLGG